jgi:uncharacterized lipoprotein YddW (UPF0748 family)
LTTFLINDVYFYTMPRTYTMYIKHLLPESLYIHTYIHT